ncbi:MAG TPA: DUF1015 family protein [Candidatus Kapabacteria bacterium]|nr:DUF1015 family protein [Candidatus Kapabacteria bacterium]
MAVFKPMSSYRPKPEFASEIAAPPYDVLNSDEARAMVEGHPLSFLHVGKPEIDLPTDVNLYDAQVYNKGKENLQKLIDGNYLVNYPEAKFYIYAQTMDGRTQFGLVGVASIQDYWNDTIKKHEKTRKDKEEDRCNHVRITNAHTGPIFLTYPDNNEINDIVSNITKLTPETDILTNDGIRHQVWVIQDKATNTKIEEIFSSIPYLYVADGHHRSAAAAIVGKERMDANPNHTGNEEYNYFLSVIFPASHLYIMDYNRLIKNLNGNSQEEFFNKLAAVCDITENNGIYKPKQKGELGLYIDGKWYKLTFKNEFTNTNDPVESLDVAILQKYILTNILGIDDPRTNKNIDFVGGIRGLSELEKRVDSGEMALAFAMHHTSIDELIAIADAGEVMPPKSTWFEPKLRDGLFVHFLD